MAASVACASSPGAEAPGERGTADTAHDEEGADAERTLLELRDTPSFQAAADRMEACLEAAGFAKDGDTRILKDGTRFGPAELMRDGFQMTHAVAEYFSANERCEEESGLAAVRRAAGVANEPLDPGFVRRANAHSVAKAACLEDRGWKFHDPVSHRGIIQYFPDLQPGDQDAYDLDEAECRAETTIP
ncbi:MAG: hypothetical protein ACRDHF_02045 [Tepidiformaceae bacterium]